MAPTPSPRTITGQQTPSRTPQSKHRLHFPNPKNGAHPSPNPLSAIKDTIPSEHPVEVIGRIRDLPGRKDKLPSGLEISQDGRSVRVRTDIGYRDLSLDGVSIAEDEDLEGFYKRFVEPRINGVRLGSKCTIMMYGPTGSGKSHTMFGCSKQPGIVYRALRDILGEGDGDRENDVDDGGFGLGVFVQVAVLEIYNEEIYDLLSGHSNGGGATIGLPKGNTPKARLEVMGKKAKNATYLSGNEAGKISREVAKVEKRRIIILDVPSVGGRLMLVDMAGSENIEAAGQIGFEAKMQTAKINQGNIALKRVVESIANGDSHVPFRDSKLTMLLQDSFEDDKSKILMILCASPDPKEMHKTISTLEYGAKAKCIVRAAHMPTPKDKLNSEESSVDLRSRIVAMNQFIYKLQMDNKLRERERDEAHKELLQKEEEVAQLRAKLQLIEGRGATVKEEEIKSKVDERTQILRIELMEMEEKMLQQQEELNVLRRRLEETEYEKVKVAEDFALQDMDGSRFMKRFSEIYSGDQGMEKSMELDMGDQPAIYDVKEIKEDPQQSENRLNLSLFDSCPLSMEEEVDPNMMRYPDKVCLSTVFEEDEEGEEKDSAQENEVDKEVVEEDVGKLWRTDGLGSLGAECHRDAMEKQPGIMEISKDAASARKTRIQNIFRLCGNHRELAQQVKVPTPSTKRPEETNIQSPTLALGMNGGLEAESPLQPLVGPLNSCMSDLRATESPISSLIAPFESLHLSDKHKSAEPQPRCLSFEASQNSKENHRPDGMSEVYVKWEATKESTGNLIKKFKVLKNSNLSDLRKLIETHLDEDNSKQPFSFLLLGGDVPLQGDFSAEHMIFGVEGVDPVRREKLIDLLDIDLQWRMHKVSDGQRRRVQICMGLLHPYKVLLLDEVTVDLDVVTRLDLLDFFREECEQRGATIVYATHIFDGLETWATDVAYIQDGELRRSGKPSDIHELKGSNNLLSVVESWLRSESKNPRKQPIISSVQSSRGFPFDSSPFRSSRHMAYYR
ncbi:Kinesin-like protein KIN-10A [Cocos nucifera]|uniref:Kinesin-like protein KIN-10A n=1 Tax=Cocos nucifera TaxID=13894 RepID=A0A8K0N8A6_COCNU|nr:Kinesin-like protein KIN-10A [Cocos nucifera]